MPIQDSNSERRNLILCCVAFIIYYYGGGEVRDDEIRLFLVNIEFSRPTAVMAIAWATLLWFFYRYWLFSKGVFASSFGSEVQECFESKWALPLIEREMRLKFASPGEEDGLVIGGYSRENGVPCISYYDAIRIQFDRITGKVTGYGVPDESERKLHKLNTATGLWLRIRVASYCFITKPSFSNYLFAYFLFAIASLGPIYDWAH